jgi:hypothetical protein
MWSRKSNDNGQSWLPDDMLSEVVSPLPAQPDPGIVSVYVGDYDYGSAIAPSMSLRGRTGEWRSTARRNKMPSQTGIWLALRDHR